MKQCWKIWFISSLIFTDMCQFLWLFWILWRYAEENRWHFWSWELGYLVSSIVSLIFYFGASNLRSLACSLTYLFNSKLVYELNEILIIPLDSQLLAKYIVLFELLSNYKLQDSKVSIWRKKSSISATVFCNEVQMRNQDFNLTKAKE